MLDALVICISYIFYDTDTELYLMHADKLFYFVYWPVAFTVVRVVLCFRLFLV